MTYKKYFTLSYDDGVHADKQMIEIIKAYGLSCTFNLNSGLMPEEDTSSWYVCKNHIPEVYKGYEIATHGHKHLWYNKVTVDEIDEDIAIDIKELSKFTGSTTFGHAFPYGAWTDDTINVLNKYGIKYARTVKSTHSFAIPTDPIIIDPTCHHADNQIFTLLEDFKNAEPTDGDMLFYLWGHSYEFRKDEEFNSWKHLEKICKAISGRDDIVYCTNMEFLNRK